MKTKLDLEETLETLVDQYSLEDVILLLSTVCSEKAEHIRLNWQDHQLASDWRKKCHHLQHLHSRFTQALY